jgi:hypothetical protein
VPPLSPLPGAPTTLPSLEGLELKQVHVIFRCVRACAAAVLRAHSSLTAVRPLPPARSHGARAPLSTKHGSGDVAWDMCGAAYQAVAVQARVAEARAPRQRRCGGAQNDARTCRVPLRRVVCVDLSRG